MTAWEAWRAVAIIEITFIRLIEEIDGWQ